MKNILEMLEASAHRFPEKTIFSDTESSVSYRSFLNAAETVGSYFAKKNIRNAPVAVLIGRSIQCLEGMFGVLYSGNFYTVIDTEMPTDRIQAIFKTLKPASILTENQYLEKAQELAQNCECVTIEETLSETIDEQKLSDIRRTMVDTDPAYILFTSGSTGVPKGAILSHKNVLSYIDWFTDCFAIREDTVFASQTPFYFSMSVSDVFGTVKSGGTLHIVPKVLFSFPLKLIEFLNERAVNTIYWVPSALSIIANLRVFDYIMPAFLDKVLFAGEVMPIKQLNYWKEKLPNALFANLFGPTETTDICTYYTVDREFRLEDTLPIGKACDNCDVFVLTAEGKKAEIGEEGELYARGSFLAMGYYKNPEKTAAAFVQNPLQNAYPETVYKTGDLVKWNERGELLYLGRADHQIKHMGYRIELGEIEAAGSAVEGISVCAVIFEKSEDKIIFVYEGKKREPADILADLKTKLPHYMLPAIILRVKSMPHNSNGKIDRKWIASHYKEI